MDMYGWPLIRHPHHRKKALTTLFNLKNPLQWIRPRKRKIDDQTDSLFFKLPIKFHEQVYPCLFDVRQCVHLKLCYYASGWLGKRWPYLDTRTASNTQAVPVVGLTM